MISAETTIRQKAFDEFVEPYGGRYIPDTEITAGLLIDYVEHLRSKLLGNFVSAARRAGNPIILEIGFVKEVSYNAFAAHHDGVDIIALNSGNTGRAMSTLHHMMDHSSIFDDMTGHEPRMGTTVDAEYLRVADLGPMIAYVGAENRLRLVQDIARQAERFLIFHEMAHILNGHVDWVGERFGARLLAENYIATEHGLSTLDYQTIEYDADATAINILVDGAVRKAMLNAGLNGKKTPITFHDGIGFEIKCLSYALYATFKLFESAPCIGIDEVLLVNHPPARIRAQLAMVGICTVLWRHFAIPLSVYRPMIAATFLDAELSWSKLTGEGLDHIFTERDAELGLALLDLYNGRWRDIHPDLNRLKLGKSIAMAWDDKA
jgi:hypothetical protein